MGFKNDDACLAKVAPNEPIFVLCAKDKFAAQLVQEWIRLAKEYGVNPAKIQEASDTLHLMNNWPNRKLPD